jgi:hypothetical protein
MSMMHEEVTKTLVHLAVSQQHVTDHTSLLSYFVPTSMYNETIPADMHVVSVMIWLDVVTSGICSAEAVTDNNMK